MRTIKIKKEDPRRTVFEVQSNRLKMGSSTDICLLTIVFGATGFKDE